MDVSLLFGVVMVEGWGACLLSVGPCVGHFGGYSFDVRSVVAVLRVRGLVSGFVKRESGFDETKGVDERALTWCFGRMMSSWMRQSC